MEHKDYWDKAASKKKFTIPVSMELFGKYLSSDSGILDFGCGYGRTLEELENCGFSKLAGVDFSENMIEIAKSNLPDVDFRINEGMNIPYEDSYFDAVIIAAVLTCIPGDDDQKKLIDEVKRVLKPGGIVFIYDFLINEDRRNIDRYEKSLQKHAAYGTFEVDNSVTLRHHTIEWIDELTCVFAKVSFEKKNFPTMNGHNSNGFCFIGKNSGI